MHKQIISVQCTKCSGRSSLPCVEELTGRADFLQDIVTDIAEDILTEYYIEAC